MVVVVAVMVDIVNFLKNELILVVFSGKFFWSNSFLL